MSVISFLKGAVDTLSGGLVGQIGDILDKTSTSDEERMQIKMAIEKQVQDHLAVMENLFVEREKIAAGDRDSARQREIAVKDFTPSALALFLTSGFFGLLGWMMYESPPPASRDILNIMIGSLGTGFITMLSYYFGSSAGSANKDKTIDSVLSKNN